MVTQDQQIEKKVYSSYDEYYKNFHGNVKDETEVEWDERPASFAKWLVRSLVKKAGAKKSSEDHTG